MRARGRAAAGRRRGGYTPGDFDLGNLSDIFAAFFGALFYVRTLSVPGLGDEVLTCETLVATHPV